MVGTVGLESFITAIACLCASSFGPLASNLSVTTLERNIVQSGALSNLDFSVLQILVNSKTKLSLKKTDNECALPDPEYISTRLSILEEDLKRQREFSQKLERELIILGAKSEPKCDCKEKDAEIKKLHEKIAALEKRKQTHNVCLQTRKHGIVNKTSSMPFNVFCDQKLNIKYGNGWMLMAQRINGRGHFFQKWNTYIKGFGNFTSEFFMGLNVLSTLTNMVPHELLIVLTDRDNVERYAFYDLILIGEEDEKFSLKALGKYTGDAGDSLRYHLGQKFSTWDNDNDESPENCAAKHSGAWWYKNCHESNLFGIYYTKVQDNYQNRRKGMIWSTFHDTSDGYLSSMRMYIRPKESEAQYMSSD